MMAMNKQCLGGVKIGLYKDDMWIDMLSKNVTDFWEDMGVGGML